MEQQEVAGRILSIDRLPNSKNGGPRWHVRLRSGFGASTAPDSTVGYAITGHEEGKPVVLTLENGLIVDLQAATIEAKP